MTCPMVASTLALAGVTACCTPTDTCGTVNMTLGGAGAACMEMTVNTTMCPDEVIMGNNVPGCCIMETNACGVTDILTGSGSCVARDDPLLSVLAQLTPINCDGTTPPPPTMMAPDAGMMGTAGSAGL
ncbi:MAG: hypothetical protein OXT09_15460 [Myxococcales bacterium]|nr:hypothetical protein [Myxococcales bacterium]